jgi:hypothetical protein
VFFEKKKEKKKRKKMSFIWKIEKNQFPNLKKQNSKMSVMFDQIRDNIATMGLRIKILYELIKSIKAKFISRA